MLLTVDGLYGLDGEQIDSPFNGKLVHHGILQQGKPIIVVDRKELWIKDKKWSRMTTSDLKINCLESNIDNTLFAGTEKARIAKIEDNLRFLSGFDDIDSRDEWWTPWGGPPDVRSMAKSSDGTLYANIHVGWIAKSEDLGKTWHAQTNGLHEDVHQVQTQENNPNIVFAATAGGFHISFDKGETFEKRWDQRLTYQRATLSIENGLYLVSASRGSSGSNSKLYYTADTGGSWKEVEGLPKKINDNINTYQLVKTINGTVFAIIENNKVYTSEDGGQSWERIVSGIPKTYQILK